jgi:hypothetical protein
MANLSFRHWEAPWPALEVAIILSRYAAMGPSPLGVRG